jgi:hypothetical protein
MEFLRLLEIDENLVAPEAQKSLLLADRVWTEEGRPREVGALCGVLEKILRRCVESNIWYAPILLQRKKALERGSWRPRSIAARAGRFSAGTSVASSDEQQGSAKTCAKCGGTGIVIRAGGFSGSFCSCGAYLSRLKRNSQKNT